MHLSLVSNMEEKLVSEGQCLYCQETYSQRGISKHLISHLVQMEKDNQPEKSVNYCHIEAKSDKMFLHLLVKGSSKVQGLDTYLRQIWLECCGHLSSFSNKINSEISMSKKVEDVFFPKAELDYEYDFGTTTELDLKAHRHYKLPAYKENIILLSRNEPLKVMCEICKTKIAKYICSLCLYKEPALFCDSCAKKHKKSCADFADYAKMPVVNSPRMGECGYEGGTIDLKRDGCFKI